MNLSPQFQSHLEYKGIHLYSFGAEISLAPKRLTFNERFFGGRDDFVKRNGRFPSYAIMGREQKEYLMGLASILDYRADGDETLYCGIRILFRKDYGDFMQFKL